MTICNEILEHTYGGESYFAFQFGAYGWTTCTVKAGSLDAALETAAEWLSEAAPGILTQPEEFDPDDLNDDGHPVDHTYTEYGYIPSWEWFASEVDAP